MIIFGLYAATPTKHCPAPFAYPVFPPIMSSLNSFPRRWHPLRVFGGCSDRYEEPLESHSLRLSSIRVPPRPPASELSSSLLAWDFCSPFPLFFLCPPEKKNVVSGLSDQTFILSKMDHWQQVFQQIPTVDFLDHRHPFAEDHSPIVKEGKSCIIC
jgi:hypothetical protein